MGADKAVLGQMIMDYSGWTLFSLAAFFVVILVIVFVHEYGHYIVGRWCGVKVEAFSVGFGKELIGYTDRHGTRWKFCAIPLGGYVKFEGDANAASQPSDEQAMHTATSLHGQPLWERAAIVAAGPIANFILAVVIFTGLFVTYGRNYIPAEVQGMIPGSAAEQAGLKVGDIIVRIDGDKVYDFEDIPRLVQHRTGDQLNVVVDRKGSEVSFAVVPKNIQIDDGLGGKATVGGLGISYKVGEGKVLVKEFGLGEAVSQAVWKTKNQIVMIMQGVKSMIVGRQSVKQVGGAVTIAKLAGAHASYGVAEFINFVAALSVSIGLINLFPIPILDGGHLVLFAIEAVFGKPLQGRALEWSYRIGLAVVVMLLALGQINDATRYLGLNFGT
jgi:regulator of sigma E protease